MTSFSNRSGTFWNRLLATAGLAGGLILSVSGCAAAKSPPDILATLRPEHPRLLITTNDWADLRARNGKDTTTTAIIKQVVAEARELADTPPVIYQKTGRRLLSVSREALRRVVVLGFAWRLTDESIFRDRAERELLNVAAFTDWNPSHFLDTAEMTAAVGIGYDWLFSTLSPVTRATLRRAILEKGLTPALTTKQWWMTGENNWNQVCFGGLSIGALAIADEAREPARQLLTLAREMNSYGLKPYAPDGIYPEGPGYWGYGTTYQVLLLSALQTALGTDWNLSKQPGFLPSAGVLTLQIGPTGRPFNFADGHERDAFYPALYWFAQNLRQPELVYFQQGQLQKRLDVKSSRMVDAFFPLLAIWTRGLPAALPPPTLPLAWHGAGHNPIGVFRGSWTDPNALYLGLKGGTASANHAHMDAGSFVLEADGVRWAIDLGLQDYHSVESKGWSLFSKSQTGYRWRVHRLNNFTHNTLTLGGKLHRVEGFAAITAFTTNSATVDLSKIFTGQAKHVVRQFTVALESRTVAVRDEIAGAKPGLSVRWQLATRAEIGLNRNTATLRQEGKTLAAKIISPAGAHFEIASAQPPDDGVNEPNPDTQMLAVNLAVPASGNLSLEIQLQPGPAASSRSN